MKTNYTLDTSLLLARIFLGIVIAGHGAQKLFGWFGGSGFEGTMNYFTDTVGLPYVLALLIILVESAGMVLLVLGLFSRLLAAAVIPIMAGAMFTVHAQFGFFMNWFGAQAGEGFEYHLLVIALGLVIALNGGGAYSLDAYFGKKFSMRNSAAGALLS